MRVFKAGYRLTDEGFTHVVLPLVIFVIVFGGIGGYVLLRNIHAATANADYFQSGISSA